MKKVLITLLMILLCFVIASCGNKQTTSANQGNENGVITNAKDTKEGAPKEKIYGLNEEAYIQDNEGNKVYSIKINGVKTANNFEYKSDFPESNLVQVIEVDYTYSNIKAENMNLIIDTGALKVADSTGNMAEGSAMYPKQKPQETTIGTNCRVQGYYGLANKSDKVRIIFTSLAYENSPTIVFEVPVK